MTDAHNGFVQTVFVFSDHRDDKRGVCCLFCAKEIGPYTFAYMYTDLLVESKAHGRYYYCH
jgi:hypothetical protein